MKVNLFKGRRIYDDAWIVGYYVSVVDFESQMDFPVIIPMDSDIYSYGEITEFDFVDPITVGQYVGAVDADGTLIFEGDILENADGVRIIVPDIRECGSIGSYSTRYRVVGTVHDGERSVREEDL